MQTIYILITLAIGVAVASSKVKRFENKLISPKRFLLDDGQITQIHEGFNVANHLAQEMNNLNFAGVTGKLVSSFSSFLGALSPFVGFVLSFLGGESSEMHALKLLFTQIENRFDQVDVQFAALRRQVSFVATQVHFTDIESNIIAVQSELDTLAKVTNTNGYKYETGEFKKTYDRTYESAGIKLYHGIVHGGLTTGGIYHEFMVYSSYDRKQTQHFMIGTLNLLMRAVTLEMTYGELNKDPNLAIKRGQWKTRITEVKNRMTAIDAEIVKHYHTQLTIDTNDFATKYPKGSLSNSDFSKKLYDQLNAKYYWRDWLVIAAARYGADKFVNHACDLNQHDNHGRSIVIASVDKKKAHVDSATFTRALNGVQLYRSFISHGAPHRVYTCAYDNNHLYGQLAGFARDHCSPYAAVGVMCTHKLDASIHAAPSRYKESVPHGANRAYVFG